MKNRDVIKAPKGLKLKAGTHYWCACGHSATQPMCDGSHRERAPEHSPVAFTLEEEKEVWLCQCKETGTPPYCDGTHRKL